MPDPSLLLLIPAYNEEARIEPVLRRYGTFFRDNYAGKFQLVVVLNGCRDNTLGVVQRVAKEFGAITWLDFPAPIGKGGALIEGLKLAGNADVIGYVDADGATGPAAVLTLIPFLEQADCVVGSRWLPGSVLLKAQPKFRQVISRCFHLIVEMLLRLHIKDTQCPCKLMRRMAVEKIHPYLRIADLAFDVNLLVAMKRAGFRLLEVPIEWTDVVGSKVTSSLLRQSLTMFLSVVRVWLIYSPKIYRWLRPLRPLEGWIYKTLRQPQPLPRPTEGKKEDSR
ncbi:MAG TPA: glycosyltransferase [Candidatus Acidoferrales bacterium]|nr:glycosyltransferase [Candidatus Acidoferrales bacterium]